MATFRKDLQPADQSSAANAYRHAFLYDQDDLAKEVRKLRRGAKSTHNRLREMISYGAIRSVAVGTRPTKRKVQVKLAIFGYNLLLLLPGLFPPGYDTDGRFNFVREELSLLKALKRKLKKRRHLAQKEIGFLNGLRDNNNTHPYEAWLMTLVISVNTFRNAK
jgi:hypothetical protein